MSQTAIDEKITLNSNNSFRDRISKLSEQDIISCYQCGECTAGCPVAFKADLSPNQISRMVQLNQNKAVLSSSMIWLCVGCETCGTRCPRGIELSRVMDALREVSIEEGFSAGDPNIKTFHSTLLSSVQRGGRIHEISMLAEYKIRTLDLFSDIFMGLQMFLKGKLAIEPSSIKGLKDIKRMFKKSNIEKK